MCNKKGRSPVLKPFIAALLVSLALSGCVSGGNMTAKLLTAKTADLSNASVQVRFIRNLYQTEAQTTEVKHVSAIWQPGANVAVINFLKREGIGMYEIDGTVKLNGELLTHLGSGAYGKVLPADDLSPQTFIIDNSPSSRYRRSPSARSTASPKGLPSIWASRWNWNWEIHPAPKTLQLA